MRPKPTSLAVLLLACDGCGSTCPQVNGGPVDSNQIRSAGSVTESTLRRRWPDALRTIVFTVPSREMLAWGHYALERLFLRIGDGACLPLTLVCWEDSALRGITILKPGTMKRPAIAKGGGFQQDQAFWRSTAERTEVNDPLRGWITDSVEAYNDGGVEYIGAISKVTGDRAILGAAPVKIDPYCSQSDNFCGSCLVQLKVSKYIPGVILPNAIVNKDEGLWPELWAKGCSKVLPDEVVSIRAWFKSHPAWQTDESANASAIYRSEVACRVSQR